VNYNKEDVTKRIEIINYLKRGKLMKKMDSYADMQDNIREMERMIKSLESCLEMKLIQPDMTVDEVMNYLQSTKQSLTQVAEGMIDKVKDNYK